MTMTQAFILAWAAVGLIVVVGLLRFLDLAMNAQGKLAIDLVFVVLIIVLAG